MTPNGRNHPAVIPVSSIISAAMRTDVDPCDIACEAMPAYVIGDLTPNEKFWVVEHTQSCRYCARMLGGFHRVNALLEQLEPSAEPVNPPTLRFSMKRRQSKALPVKPQAAPLRAAFGYVSSPVGSLAIAVSDQGVCDISFARGETESLFVARLRQRGFEPEPDQAAVEQVRRQLDEYFQGRRDTFDIAVDFAGMTPFTRSVLTATAEVPYGELTSYGQIAARIGQPGASRAVGNALGRNPVPVIVPCHRIIRSDASIGKYTGGIDIKRKLLAIEGRTAPWAAQLPLSSTA
ncbi:MAG: methylated-DNA--[protein]-cysteine S-methyltransferase [Chloroflexota bacterium]|nr:methylated-DNA--[protein]-cysteine S-methyltransferase [Chloroflexota bacterium]